MYRRVNHTMIRHRSAASSLSRAVFPVCIFVAHVLCGAHAAETAGEFNAEGVEHYQAEHWSDAVAAFESAYRLEPGNETIRRNLCNAYHALAVALAKGGDFQTAVDRLQNAISLEPGNPIPLIQLGVCYLRLGLVSEAVFRLEEAVDLDPENVDAQELLGQAYYADNDAPAALAQWRYVLELQPGRPGIEERIAKAAREDSVERNFSKTFSRHFRVSYGRGASGGDLRFVLSSLELAYRNIGRQLGGVYPPTPIEVILYTADDFSRATLLGEHVGAVYDSGKIRVPINDKTGRTLGQDELQRRLWHEYVHAVVRFWAGDNVPWWLNEGLAETLSRGPVDLQGTELLRLARRDGVLFGLADLEDDQLEKLDRDALQLAYVQAHTTVHYLWARFGVQSLAAYMNALAQGTAPEEALVQAYRRQYDVVQKDVAASLGRAGAP